MEKDIHIKIFLITFLFQMFSSCARALTRMEEGSLAELMRTATETQRALSDLSDSQDVDEMNYNLKLFGSSLVIFLEFTVKRYL